MVLWYKHPFIKMSNKQLIVQIRKLIVIMESIKVKEKINIEMKNKIINSSLQCLYKYINTIKEELQKEEYNIIKRVLFTENGQIKKINNKIVNNNKIINKITKKHEFRYRNGVIII